MMVPDGDSWVPRPVAPEERALEVGRSYDALAESYDSFHTDRKSLAENRYVARVLRSLLRDDQRVADLGCGTGLLLELQPRAPARYVGVDISRGMLACARRKFPEHRFLHADAQRPIAELRAGSADAVVSLFGAPSYCDLELLWAEVQRLLRPGGLYYLMFCGPSYVNRSTYINKGNGLLNAYDTAQIARVCAPERLWGTSRLIDAMPGFLPDAAFDAALELEERTLGRIARDACYFLHAVGRKAG